MKPRVLVVGAGSIGKRHIRALVSNGILEIGALRSMKGSVRAIDSDIKDVVKEFYDDESAFDWEPTHLIISNPTRLHVDYLIKGIKKGCYIFVEKPVVASFNELKVNYSNLINELYKTKGQVGFNLRFSGLIKAVNDFIKEGKLGRLVFAQMEVGHYLPHWHPYEDYRQSYAARKDLGGGVLRTLSHEVDLAGLFFGEFKQITASVEKNSHLEIDVDDCVNILGKMSECARVNIHLNYLYPKPTRQGKIIGEKGLLTYDFSESCITFQNFTDKEIVRIDIKEDYQQQYINQMEHFIRKDMSACCSIQEGLKVDELIELCEKSSDENKVINV